ncbi:uncharacterized protein N7482_009836 [Penicillium canariense]|uniref:Uncharacterized protein n=1 Tax=Penicillium canariense TaxID=189055 RepID=A0A9W9HQV8_9EURO|nr:uncharacterized protein N7482_009836 [Penicillium canariense]KAJ5153358.1 hypothetical protein N7482_009836 [Penicillium canariense]
MGCAKQQVSYATWRLQIFWRLLGPSHPAPSRRGFWTSHAQHDQPHDEAPSHAVTNSLPPSKRLPQSPLITYSRSVPVKRRKKLPTAEDVSELKKNPWAAALASPVRMCSVSGARLPRDLLGEWGLVRRPNTDNSYLLPVDLLKDSLQTRQVAETTSQDKATPLDPADLDPAIAAPDTPLTANSIRNEKLGNQLLLRMINSFPLLKGLSKPLSKNTGKKPAISRILPFRWKHPLGPITSRVEKQLVWRQDMAEYVLQLRQSDVVKKLEEARRRYKRLDIPNRVWSVLDVQECSETTLINALGQLGPLDRMACGAVLLTSPGCGGACPETVLNPSTQSQIPVFDLSALLSPSELAKLCDAEAPHFQSPALFFRPDDRIGVEAMLSLWKLQRFIAETPH